jgi:hypothetical protein
MMGDVFYHCTSWTDVTVGQRVGTSWEASHYWTEKSAGTAPIPDGAAFVDQVTMTIDQVTAASPQLGPAAALVRTIANQLATRLGDYKRKSELLKELLFEQVRADAASERPSRAKCMFLFDSDLDPGRYLRAMPGLAAVRPMLLRVRAMDGAIWHRGPLSLLNCDASPIATIKENARRYWGTGHLPGYDTEVLLVGDVEVEVVAVTPGEQHD